MSDCQVCCEKFNKSTRKKITCLYCDYCVCTTCNKKYFLDSLNDPHCLSCKKNWTNDFMESSFTKTFINNEYKKHRENVLFDRELSLMPITQPYIETEKKRLINLEKISVLKNKFKEVRRQMSDIFSGKVRFENRLEYNRSLTDLEKKEFCLKKDIGFVKYEFSFINNNQNTNNAESSSRAQFVRKCPAENCKGFLSSAWKCGICDIYVCNECYEIKGDSRDAEHECDPKNVETAKLLAKDSKSCPSCGIMIMKHSGCDQMYCTNCNTAFSWKTREIVTTNIHNPHYYEYMRQRGNLNRNIQDIPCGGLPRYIILNNVLLRTYHNTTFNVPRNPTEVMILEIHRLLSHIQNVELPRYVIDNNNVDRNRDLRIQYMLNKIDEKTFKQKLQQLEKANNKKREFGQLLNMLLTISSDIFNRFLDNPSINYSEEILQEFQASRQYVNQSAIKIHNRFNCVSFQINDKWFFEKYPIKTIITETEE